MAAATAVVPDLDAIGRPFHRGDVAWLGGHRAVTHSVFFALLVAAIAGIVGRWSSQREPWIVVVGILAEVLLLWLRALLAYRFWIPRMEPQ